MESYLWLVFATILSVLLVVVLIAKRARSAIAGDREDRSLRGIYHAHYKSADSDDSTYTRFCELWLEVAHTVHIASERLRPTDRFDKELKGTWLVDHEIDELSDVANARAVREKRVVDLQKIHSVDDYLRAFMAA